MMKLQKIWCLTTLIATSIFFLAGIHNVTVSANNTPQITPFSQNWTDTGLITTNDDWSGVPGIVGYLGDITATANTGVDPRTLLLDYEGVSAVDVIANQTNPNTLATGGVVEFGITDPVVALQGSGTADAPHILIHLTTIGQSGIQFTCNIRDIDGSADDAVQQIDVQYRVGGSGNYVSVPGGYIADATAAGTATMVTPINVILSPDADNQALVQIRIITTNATGNDEWVGIDDINVSSGASVTVDAPNDINGDGRSDYVVARNIAGQIRWFYNLNGTGAPTVAVDWGLSPSDYLLLEDFDGDNKADITVWRDAPALEAAFYILQSATNTARVDVFGASGDVPNIVADYDGDEKADVAVYRHGATGGQSLWFYRGSLTPGVINYVPWGVGTDFVAPGDYDGDGRSDFVVQRNSGAGQAVFWSRLANGTILPVIAFGHPSDIIVPGDYDGDGKCDIATTRNVGGAIQWQYLSSLTGSIVFNSFGLAASDFPTQGDYDGDGKVEPSVWRPSAQSGQSYFFSMNSSDGAVQWFQLGQDGDHSVNSWNSH